MFHCKAVLAQTQNACKNPVPSTKHQLYCSCTAGVGRFLQKHKMDKPLSEDEPLATGSTKELRTIFHFFADWTSPPEFKEIHFERFDSEMWGEQRSQLEESFKALAEKINPIIKREYEMEDRKSVNKRKTAFVNFRVVYFLIWIIVGIIMVTKIAANYGTETWRNGVLQVDLVERYCIQIFVGMFVVGVVTMISFYCCCSGTDVLMIMDRRLQQNVKPTLDQWNSTIPEHEVCAEFRVEEVERKEKVNVKRIPPTLNLWKKGEHETEFLV